MDTLSRSDAPAAPPAREPRTFELREGEWAEATPGRRLRVSRWILVPAVLAALTGIVLILLAALAALATGGLVALRSTVVDQIARLRGRFSGLVQKRNSRPTE
jgi:hypothetical protein